VYLFSYIIKTLIFHLGIKTKILTVAFFKTLTTSEEGKKVANFGLNFKICNFKYSFEEAG